MPGWSPSKAPHRDADTKGVFRISLSLSISHSTPSLPPTHPFSLPPSSLLLPSLSFLPSLLDQSKTVKTQAWIRCWRYWIFRSALDRGGWRSFLELGDSDCLLSSLGEIGKSHCYWQPEDGRIENQKPWHETKIRTMWYGKQSLSKRPGGIDLLSTYSTLDSEWKGQYTSCKKRQHRLVLVSPTYNPSTLENEVVWLFKASQGYTIAHLDYTGKIPTQKTKWAQRGGAYSQTQPLEGGRRWRPGHRKTLSQNKSK